MCDPVTATLVISSAISAGSQVYAGKVESANQKYAAQIADQNAAYSQRAANDAIERGDKDALAHYQKVAAIRGQQRAQMAASGLDTSLGSPLDVLTETSVYGGRDADTIRENAQRETSGYLIDAANHRASAISSRANAKNAMTGAYIGAASTIASSAAQISSYKAKYGKPKLENGIPSAFDRLI